MNTRTTIKWARPKDELPDDCLICLLALDDGEYSIGFREAGQWRSHPADESIESAEVMWWAPVPDLPDPEA